MCHEATVTWDGKYSISNCATGIRYKPIVSMTNPLTNGGNKKRILPIIEPRKKWIIPPIKHAVKATPKPCVLATTNKTETKAKLVPCIIGSRDPTGPNPIV